MSSLSSNLSKSKKLTVIYSISQTENSALYTSVLNGTTILPAYSIVELVPTSGQKEIRIVTSQKTWTQAAGGSAANANKAAYQAPTTAVDIAAMRTDFNALLTKLQNAGLMATS